MAKTQDIIDGVLVRPLETLATNFLSSRYYNGRRIVDLLGTPEDARRWIEVIHVQLHGPRPFTPTTDELVRLRDIRGVLEASYGRTVDNDFSTGSLNALNDLLAEPMLRPRIDLDRNGVAVAAWTPTPDQVLAEFTATVLVASVDTLTGPRAPLLRKCHAPRCVLYFTQLDSRQHWCSNICGNRARVARAATRANSSE
ncbi:CGNR zinc finger domain-containing protein [Rhodococcus triatomae]|uniref:CGNR zinc finger domain-containing protein n=1 Tax=Rhodococcus triatomae TaxID=300028 RepID=A0A1G8QL30_9NOCA|nr:CGNR zinc finger domain-containing protein [Rhodococcus triatomae]QNG20636.1 CGNR zinc finger domain-containing protein [Rhodococcus triatomae]QNG23446.1 CGNR zinc finger domain-containing protein [Rhodococcus triatomae]SDJ05509.1 CGNR zinc finger domain-containing protein [Rhodococcus triatomae]